MKDELFFIKSDYKAIYLFMIYDRQTVYELWSIYLFKECNLCKFKQGIMLFKKHQHKFNWSND